MVERPLRFSLEFYGGDILNNYVKPLFALALLLVSQNVYSTNPTIEDYFAAYMEFDSLSGAALKRQTMPRITEDHAAKVIATLSDTNFLTNGKYQAEDIEVISEVCGKANGLIKLYAYFDPKGDMSLDRVPQLNAAQLQLLINMNFEIFQDELVGLQSFLIECFATEETLVATFTNSLPPEKLTDVRRNGIQMIREGALGMYVSVLMGLTNSHIKEKNRSRLLKSIRKTAPITASVFAVERRKQLAEIALVALRTAPESFRDELLKIHEAMSSADCQGLCKF